MKKNFEFYNKEEIKNLLLSDEKLVYVDNGIDEYVVRYKDLPDFIVDISRSMGHHCELKVYKYPAESMTPILTTMGEFLDKCDADVRRDIIDRLIKVQTTVSTKKYKIIGEYDLEMVQNEIIKDLAVEIHDIWLTDNEDVKCNATILLNGKERANIITRFDRIDYADWKNSQKEIKEEIIADWEKYLRLPNISKCSKLLKEIYKSVCESDASMCHITDEDWQTYYKDRYTDKDIDTLQEEIKKYHLEDVITLKNDDDYKIIGWGDLETKFNNDTMIRKEKEYER